MKDELDIIEDSKEETKDKRGKKRSDKAKTKKTSFLIKRLKLKSKHSPSSSASQSETSIEPQPSTSSESSPAETQIVEADDTDITLAKSASDTNLSESSWKSAENLTTERKRPTKTIVNVETSQLEISISKEEQRAKSLGDLKDMPAFGELIFDSNMVNIKFYPSTLKRSILTFEIIETTTIIKIETSVNRYLKNIYYYRIVQEIYSVRIPFLSLMQHYYQ